jgi:CheY-like chemotaxis protein
VPTSPLLDAARDGSRRRVVIADDDPDTLAMYAWGMRAAGWLVTEAIDGYEAIEAAATLRPHAIVMDLSMPGLGGVDAVVRLKLDVRTRTIPVIACSGIDRAEGEPRARRAGCEAFVAKPCSPDELCAVVDEVTQSRRYGVPDDSHVSLTDLTCTSRPLAGLHVLVADDDADLRDMLESVMHSQGATCVAARSGDEAFALFQKERPSIVLSDVWMPAGDGFELIKRIRALPPARGGLTPAIGISGQANAEQALMAGYQVLLPKPIDLAMLVGTLREFLDAEHDGPVPATGSTWGMASSEAGRIELSFAGYIAAADAREAMGALARHLAREPCRLLVDLRGVTGFSVAGASEAQKAIWPNRHAILHVTIAGGPLSARVVASAACHLLGIGCTMEGPTK